ncbi:hypothetical protein B0H13DRAFT_1886822 [Mycena leptocephala]|nr:hypothetical protein B0H13DRAFT_1886822 [Mycena leptocephala]
MTGMYKYQRPPLKRSTCQIPDCLRGISTLFISSFPGNVPADWTAHVHPEGALYYVHKSLLQNIFTDGPLHEKPAFDIATGFIRQIEVYRSKNAILADRNVDLVLDFTSGANGQPECGYYLADHNQRIIFWYDEFDLDCLPRYSQVHGVRSPHHTKIELTAQYCELRDTVVYSIGDRMNAQTSTVGSSIDDLLKILTVVESLKGNIGTRYSGTACIIAIQRAASSIIFTVQISDHSPTMKATVLLNANVAFLALPTVNDGVKISMRSAGQIASYISVVASLGSVIVGLTLLHQNRKRRDDEMHAVVDFLGSHFHERFGFESLALLHSLPFAWLMWGQNCRILDSIYRNVLSIVRHPRSHARGLFLVIGFGRFLVVLQVPWQPHFTAENDIGAIERGEDTS